MAGTGETFNCLNTKKAVIVVKGKVKRKKIFIVNAQFGKINEINFIIIGSSKLFVG
jgi:hypothetical protein